MTKIKDIIRGDTRSITVTFYESDGVTPINLTGGTVKFTVSDSANPAASDTPVIQKTVTSHTTPASGITTITLLPADFPSGMEPGIYYYDVQLTTSGGTVVSKKQSTFEVVADITR